MNITQLIDVFKLDVLSKGEDDTSIEMTNSIRCGMQLGGFYGHFHEKRIQLIGNAEIGYLESLTAEESIKSVTKLLDHNIPCLILTNGLRLNDEIIAYAKSINKWVLATQEATSEFITDMTLYLSNVLAECISIHGELLNVFGMGVLIKGDSGVGKSTAAIELIRRGHLFVADDVVKIKKINSQLLVGEPEQMTKNLIECRGVGIVNINSLFGKSAIRQSSTINLIINIKKLNEDNFNRDMGEEIATEELMGVELPIIEIPVKPGHFIPTSLIEIGALNIRQNQMGHNTAKEFLKSMKSMMDKSK